MGRLVSSEKYLLLVDGGDCPWLLRRSFQCRKHPEQVCNRETGLLFERRDATGLSEILRTLVQDEPLRRRLAAPGQRMVGERFSIQSSVERTSEIYSKLINSR